MLVLAPAVFAAWVAYGFFNPTRSAWTVAWSADSQMLAAGYGGYGKSDFDWGDQDATVRLWNVGKLDKPLTVLHKYTDRVMGVAFSPDGKWLASGNEWGKTLLWNLHDLSEEPIVMDDDKYPDTGSQILAFSPDGRWLAGTGGSYEELGVWDLTDPRNPSTGLPDSQGSVGDFAWLPQDDTLVAALSDNSVVFWNVSAPQTQTTKLPNTGTGIRVLAVSRDGRLLAGAGEEGAARLWDLGRRDVAPRLLPGERVFYTSMDFSPDGNTLVASTRDDYRESKLLSWDLRQPESPPTGVRGAGEFVTKAAFSPDGKWLAASCYDGKVRLWEANKLNENPMEVKK